MPCSPSLLALRLPGAELGPARGCSLSGHSASPLPFCHFLALGLSTPRASPRPFSLSSQRSAGGSQPCQPLALPCLCVLQFRVEGGAEVICGSAVDCGGARSSDVGDEDHRSGRRSHAGH